MHIPNARRSKLDGRSILCILVGANEVCEGYRLYDPIKKQVSVSRDVVF